MTTYEKLFKKYGLIDQQVGENEDGEYVIVAVTKNYAVITTSQKNGWLRNNTYWKDGTEEESYER